jgi:anti-sigma B factor antagonist
MPKMSWGTKFVALTGGLQDEILPDFHGAKAGLKRLCNRVNMNYYSTTWERPAAQAAMGMGKESKLKLSLETRNRGEVIIVHCQGRIVYREEATSLSRLVGELLHGGSKVVLDLAGVSSMDSAGIGELALLETWAQERDADLKIASANETVNSLLDLTNLDSVLEVHPSVEAALEAFDEEPIYTDC